VSSTLEDPAWNKGKVLKGDVVTECRSSSSSWTEKSSFLPASSGERLTEHDLVDELRLVVFPVVLGAGERRFGETTDKKAMQLLDAQDDR
jgi:RibD C-terminal domain